MKTKQLIGIAEELNKVLGLDPAIKTSRNTDEALQSSIAEAAEFIEPEDEISPLTIKGLKELGLWKLVDKKVPAPEPKKGSKKQPEPELESEDESGDEELGDEELGDEDENSVRIADMLEEIKIAKKIDELKELLEDKLFHKLRDELAAEKNPIKLKAAMRNYLEPKPVEGKPKDKALKPGRGRKSEVNQTSEIRRMIKSKTSREDLLKSLAETFSHTLGWAEARMKLYEKSYGEMGINDNKINQ